MDATEGAASRVSLAPGDMVGGRYRAATLLARGGMGEVWSADDVVLERTVALKVLRGEIASDAAVARRFEAEARAAARLRSRHTVAVFDAGRDDHRLFLVMERLPGTNLADEIAAGPLGPKPVREMRPTCWPRLPRRTTWASSTATSSPATSCGTGYTAGRSLTSVSPRALTRIVPRRPPGS